MNPRLGQILGWLGFVAAGLCALVAFDAIWLYDTGRSIFPGEVEYRSLEETAIQVVISAIFSAFFWQAGKGARNYLSKPVGAQRAGK